MYKARVTPKGFLQREGINFFETFAATGKYKSLRLGLMLTAACGHNPGADGRAQAFLNADIDEEVYMEVPEGYRAGKEHLVCRLKKALYGLKQAPRNWYLLISKFVQEELGFRATVSDPCLFFRRSKTGRLMLVFLFVDDFQISYHPEDKAEWNALKAKLVDRFKTKDLGESTWILGMRITRDLKARTITLDQEQHVTKALRKFGMDQCKAVSTPGVPGGASAETAAAECRCGGCAALPGDGGHAHVFSCVMSTRHFTRCAEAVAGDAGANAAGRDGSEARVSLPGGGQGHRPRVRIAVRSGTGHARAQFLPPRGVCIRRRRLGERQVGPQVNHWMGGEGER